MKKIYLMLLLLLVSGIFYPRYSFEDTQFSKDSEGRPYYIYEDFDSYGGVNSLLISKINSIQNFEAKIYR